MNAERWPEIEALRFFGILQIGLNQVWAAVRNLMFTGSQYTLHAQETGCLN